MFSFLFFPLQCIGTLHSACCTGGIVGSRQMEYSPGMLPTVSKEVGTAFLNLNMSSKSDNDKWSLKRGYTF